MTRIVLLGDRLPPDGVVVGIGGLHASGHPGEDHQHDDFAELEANVAFVGPAGIGDGEGKIHQFFQNTSFGD